MHERSRTCVILLLSFALSFLLRTPTVVDSFVLHPTTRFKQCQTLSPRIRIKRPQNSSTRVLYKSLSSFLSSSERETNEDPSSPSSAPPPAPISRFLKGLYAGLTFPFPTLRKLTLDTATTTTTSGKTEKETSQINFSLREALAAIAVYLFFGAVSYHSTVLQAPEGQLPWSFVDALYFSVVTFSTVGYGDLTPTSGLGKAFTILFGLSGISILGIAISTIGSRLAAVESTMVAKARKITRRRMKAFWHTLIEERHSKHGKGKKPIEATSSTKSPKSDSSTADETEIQKTSETNGEVPLWKQTLGSLLTKSIPAFALIVVGGVIMGKIEGWSILDSCYYAFITAVTLGYGDFSPMTKPGRIWAIVFIPLAVAAAGEVLGNVATTIQERRQEKFYKSLMERELNVDRLLEMDTNHDGKVSREEYVEFMLKEMELVSQEEFAELHDQFEKLDTDGGGFLDKNDLKELLTKTENNTE